MFRYTHLRNLLELFTNDFIANKEIHVIIQEKSRNSSLIHKKCYRTNYSKHSLANKRIDVWNDLPTQYTVRTSNFTTPLKQ